MKKAIALLLIICMLLSLGGCVAYITSQPDLYVVAVHSLLGVWGGDREGILVLEEDDFGRIMFAYGGSTIISSNTSIFNVVAVLIV